MLPLAGAMTAARAVGAQQKAMPVIGFLVTGSPGSNAPLDDRVGANREHRIVTISAYQRNLMNDPPATRASPSAEIL